MNSPIPGSQGTDRLGRVPRGKEVRARVIESLLIRRRTVDIKITVKSRQSRDPAFAYLLSVEKVPSIVSAVDAY
jgi:hypothetical protein